MPEKAFRLNGSAAEQEGSEQTGGSDGRNSEPLRKSAADQLRTVIFWQPNIGSFSFCPQTYP
jgi:hypothetical protein